MTDSAMLDRPVGRLLRRPEVEARVGLCRSAIYQRMAAGTFPRPRRIGKRAVRWPSDDIDRWIRAQPPG